MSSNVKLRPYLSVAEINHILEKLRDDTSTIGVGIRKNLSLLSLKYDGGYSRGSYTPSPRQSTLEKLGAHTDELRYLNGEMSAQEEAEYESNLINFKGEGG